MMDADATSLWNVPGRNVSSQVLPLSHCLHHIQHRHIYKLRDDETETKMDCFVTNITGGAVFPACSDYTKHVLCFCAITSWGTWHTVSMTCPLMYQMQANDHLLHASQPSWLITQPAYPQGQPPLHQEACSSLKYTHRAGFSLLMLVRHRHCGCCFSGGSNVRG